VKDWYKPKECPFLNDDNSHTTKIRRGKSGQAIEERVLAHTNGDLDCGITNVLVPKDGEVPPVWRGNPGDRAHVELSCKPWLDDNNAAEAQYAPGKVMHPVHVGVDGGIGSVVFGGHPMAKPSKGPKPKTDFMMKNRVAMGQAKAKGAPVVRPQASRGGSKRGSTARPEPLTGRGLWDPNNPDNY